MIPPTSRIILAPVNRQWHVEIIFLKPHFQQIQRAASRLLRLCLPKLQWHGTFSRFDERSSFMIKCSCNEYGKRFTGALLCSTNFEDRIILIVNQSTTRLDGIDVLFELVHIRFKRREDINVVPCNSCNNRNIRSIQVKFWT